MNFLHERDDIDEVYEVLSRTLKVPPAVIEKDYWLMHCLWALKEQAIRFELKGGTSLSKGYEIIDRFSEDIDIHIHPPDKMTVRTGKNDRNASHIDSRIRFFDWVAANIRIPGVSRVERDQEYDDEYKRNAGIWLMYDGRYEVGDGIKQGILLEVGFDDVTPNEPKTISSWAYTKAAEANLNIVDNRAKDILCYCPEYTFVEKLQTISTKFRQQKETGLMPKNFIRHYYDVYQLLTLGRVQSFIGTEKYIAHKERRFRAKDEKNLSKNEAFILSDHKTRELYRTEYDRIAAIFYRERPTFAAILGKISEYLNRL